MKNTFICLFFTVSQPLLAQTDTAKILATAEVTAIRLNRYAVGQTFIRLDTTTLHAYQEQNVGDLLQNSIPLSIKGYGNTLSTATIRGTASQHTAVIWNGLNIQNALTGLADLSALEGGTVEQISVKLGGGSALYGSGAIGGTVFLDNIIPKNKRFHANIGTTLGSYGLFGQNAKAVYNHQNTAFQMRISHQKADNNFLYKNIATLKKPIEHAQNAAFDNLNVTNNAVFNLKKDRFLHINTWYSHILRQIPPIMTARNDSANQNEHSFKAVAELSMPLFTHNDNMKYKNTLKTPQTVLKTRLGFIDDNLIYNSETIKNSQNSVKTLVADIETIIDYKNTNSLRLGVNFTGNQTKSSNLGSLNHQRSRFALFASQVWQLKNLKLSANMRQELVDDKIIPFVYSMGVEKRLKNAENGSKTGKTAWLLRGSFSRNHNLPALNDLYWNNLGNPDLKAETGISGELGLDMEKKTTQSTVKLGITTFALKTNNWIQWSPNNNGIWQPNNLKSVFSRGIETFFNISKKHDKITWNTQLTYQLSRATEGTNKQLLYTPIHTASASFSVHINDLYINYIQNISSKRPMIDGFTDAFTLGNMSIIQTVSLGKNTAQISLNVYNIWNVNYQIIQYYIQPKQRFQGKISVGF